MPPVQTILRAGSNAVMVNGNVRPGVAFAWTVTFSPGAIRPVIFSTVEFQPG
jgi:hypothetical protein